jgi:hypothetical protein
LHVAGVGHAPNRSLTQQAAAAGRGLELLASTHAEANAAARRLVAGTAGPVLTQVSVSGSAITGHTPSALRDVFAGQPLLFTVELSREGGTLEISASLAGSGHAWVHRLHVPATGTNVALGHTPLPLGALHGREVVAWLERGHANLGHPGFFSNHGHDAATLDHLVESAAMRHRIVSRRTSLVAIAEEPAVDPRAPRRRTRLAVEVPAGVSADGVGLGRGGEQLFAPRVLLHRHQIEVAASRPRSLGLSTYLADALSRALATGLPRKRRTPRVPVELEVAGAHWFAPDVLVIEFVLPFEGVVTLGSIELAHEPGDGRVVKLRVEVVPEMGTEAGAGIEGRIVKLALRLATEERPVAAGVLLGKGTYLVHSSKGGQVEVPVHFRLDVPESGPAGAHPPGAGPGR